MIHPNCGWENSHRFVKDMIPEFMLGKEAQEISMNSAYTALIKQDGDWWIGWIEEVPGVNCQERTREDLLETLKITLREALEFNRGEAIDAAGSNYDEELIGV